MHDPKRHHYLPEFYQKGWLGADNKVTVFRRVYGGRLVALRKARKSVGWETELYSDLSEADPKLRQRLESMFLSRVDNLAHEALVEMLTTGKPPAQQERANAWARYIMSLLHRHPSMIARLRESVERHMSQTNEDLDSYINSLRNVPEEIKENKNKYTIKHRIREQILNLLLASVVDSENVGNAIMQMTWSVGVFNKSQFSLMTSDRPLIRSDGLGRYDSFIIIPISPKAHFMAARRVETLEAFHRLSANRMARFINNAICLQAEKFVISENEKQTIFIDHRLGKSARYEIQRDPTGSIFWPNMHRFDPWLV